MSISITGMISGNQCVNQNYINNTENKDDVTQYSSYEEAVKASQATIDTKAERIIAQANAGKKLSEADLEYLAKNCPEAYTKIKAALEEREKFEQEMKAAKSKLGVTGSYVSHLSDVKKTSEDGYEMKLRISQLTNAHDSYIKTDEYKKKDDEEKQAKRTKEKIKEEKKRLEEQIEDNETSATEQGEETSGTEKDSTSEKTVTEPETKAGEEKLDDEDEHTEKSVFDIYKQNRKKDDIGIIINKSV